MPTSTKFKTLRDIALHRVYKIEGFQILSGGPELTSRLQHSGFVRGETVEIIQRGIGSQGNLIVRLGGHTHFALRPNEAELILVGKIAAAKPSTQA